MARECGCIVVGDFKQAAPGRKKRCGTEKRLNPKPGDEMKADAAPPPLAAHEGKKKKKGATKKSVRGRKEKKSNDYAQKKVIP